jgi:RES domain-containing protein
VLIPVDVPDDLIDEPEIPSGWNALPESAAARHLGDRWIESAASVAVLVPSVILPADKNILINPAHPDFGKVRVLPVEAFAFDRRLLH